MVQAQWKTVWRFLRTLKIELPRVPVIPLLDVYLEKTLIQKDTCIPEFTAAPLTIARTQQQPKSPTDNWLKKM